MAWDNLASNQMVSYSEALTSPFALRTSPGSGNQCMTKAQILAMYYVTISGYSDNELVPKSVWIGSTFKLQLTVSKTTGALACADFNRFINAYSNVRYPGINDIIYSDANLTTRFNGNYGWFGSPVIALQIAYDGRVVTLYDCIY